MVELLVEKLTHGGQGLARSGGKVVFIPGVIPGEQVDAEIEIEKPDYSVARVVRITTPAPSRVAPPCPYFGRCGGCQFQHIGYPAQLEFKRAIVEEALARIGKLAVTVGAPVGMADPWHYRNKTQYPAAGGAQLRLGYFRAGTHDVIDIEACLIHPTRFDELAALVRTLVHAHGETVYDERTGRGNLRHVVVRQGFATGQTLLVLVTRTPELTAGLRDGLGRAPGLVGLVQSINPAPTNRILGTGFRTLAGQDFHEEVVRGLRLRVSAGAFFQVNTPQTEQLVGLVERFLELTGGETVLDLYCGVGTIGLALAGHCRSVVGVEQSRRAVRDAQENARANQVTNASFQAGSVEEFLEGAPAADAVVLDPPRKGAGAEVLTRIAKLGPRRVIYVSCDPATLGRDLGFLVKQGYQVDEVVPVDLFPQTFHVETVCRLTRI